MQGIITRLLLAGRNNREIAVQLFMAESTVKTHILNIYRQLGMKNRVQLANLFPPGENMPFCHQGQGRGRQLECHLQCRV